MIKDNKMNVKRILALLLTAAMVMPFNYAVKAETTETAETTGGSGAITAEDEAERNQDAWGVGTTGKKVMQYLAKEYPLLDTAPEGGEKDNIVNEAEMRANTSYDTIVIDGSKYPEITKNMVQFRHLGNLENVTTLKIQNVDEIRNLFLPPNIKVLEIRNTTLNLYSDGGLTGGTSSRYSWGLKEYNLEKIILDNVTIGNRKENHTSDDCYGYDNNITLNIGKCEDLNEFKVNVGFESDNSSLTFDAGDKQFSELIRTQNCSITKSTSNGRITVASSNADSFFRRRGDAVTAVNFYNDYFKQFLIQIKDLDKNSDGILTQDELNAVTDLTIEEVSGSLNIDVIHDFRDLQHLSNLENLTIELGRDTNAAYIEEIILPDTGRLKKVTIKNTLTKLDSMVLPGLEEFTYTDNACIDSYPTKPSIKINDTAGRLNSVNVCNSDISSLELNNGLTSGDSPVAKQLTSINVSDCPNLGTVEFTGSGYILPGNAYFANCVNLKAIGKKNGTEANASWQIDGNFGEGNSAVLDISNCSNFGSASSNILLNYNFAEGKTLSVYAYEVKKLEASHTITTSRTDTTKGSVKIYCGDGDNWLKDTYGKNGNNQDKVAGHSVILGSSTPNIAIFPNGNEILDSKTTCKLCGENCTTKSHQWVGRWDIVLRMGDTGDTINNFNNLSYYVAENDENGKEIRRKVYYGGPVYFVIDHPEIVRINSTNGTLETLKKGKANIKVYRGTESQGEQTPTPSDENYLGEVNVYVRSIATDITLVNNNPGLGSGSESDPIIIEKGKGKLSFSATTSYDKDKNGNVYLRKDENGNEIQDEVYWIFANYKNGCYSDMQCTDGYPESTEAGISLVAGSDTWEGRTNTRDFTFSKSNLFRITAQVHVNKTGNAPNGSLIRKDLFIKVVDPKSNNSSGSSATQNGSDTSEQSSSSSGGGSSQVVWQADTGAGNTKSNAEKQAVLSYVAPGKQTVAKTVVMNPNGTSTIVEVHSDGTVSYKTELQKTTVASVNMALSANLNPLAPTAVNGISVIVDRSGAQATSKITKVTAEVDAVTVNGNINVSPQLISSLKSLVAGEIGKNAPVSIDIKLNTLAADGKALSIIIDSASLKNNGVLKAYAIDPLTGGYIMIDLPALKYNKKSGLTISGLVGGFEYQFVSSKDIKKIENQILNSVKLSDQFSKTVQVSPGAVLDMSKALSTDLNIGNVQKIEYSVSGNKAVINPTTGLLVINANASQGIVTVNIKVTLKNGKTKTIKAKVKI